MLKNIFTILILFFVIIVSFSYGQIPKQINYQGLLTDKLSGEPLTGTVDLTFQLYKSADCTDIDCAPGNSCCIWSETHLGVQLNNGLFNVQLGSTNPLEPSLFSEADRWLGVTVGTDSEMTPRQKFASSAYAMVAEQSSPIKFKESGILLVNKTTTDWNDVDYVDIDFSSGELDPESFVIVELQGEKFNTQTLYLRAGVRNTTLPGEINGQDWHYAEIVRMNCMVTQHPTINDQIVITELKASPTGHDGTTTVLGKVATGDTNVFTTAWTLRITGWHNIVASDDSIIRYYAYVMK